VLRLWLIATVIEICLANLCLILGCRSLTAMAASWGIACFAAMIEGFRLFSPFMREFDFSAYRKAHWKTHLGDVQHICEIALPIALSELGLVASSFLNLHMISLLPGAKTLEAAWAIKTRIEEFVSFAPACAVAFSVTPFVARYSQSRWNNKQVWATNILLTAITISTIAPILVCLILQLMSGALVRIFTTEAAVQEKACLVLTLSSFAWPFFTITQLVFSALAGKGKTFLPSIATLICILPLRFGLALLLKDCPALEGITAITISGVIAQAVLAACMIGCLFATMKMRLKAGRIPSFLAKACVTPDFP
jgi:Na+-driven multidrug efflux pump